MHYPLHDISAPYGSGRLDVGDGHVLYWEQSGNPDGRPVLFLHGGPGAVWPDDIRRLVDPALFRFIALDQRGAYRSRSLGEVSRNTTQDLIHDIEMLRAHLGVREWIVFGGSWGSCLGLTYAIRHPEVVQRLVLWGIYLARAGENIWANQIARWLRPAEVDALVKLAGTDDPLGILRAFRRLVDDPDPAIRHAALDTYEAHQAALANVQALDKRLSPADRSPEQIWAEVRIGLNYFLSDGFLPADHILQQAHRLAGIPGTIVHGAEDLLCPLANAHDLAAVWPDAELVTVPGAGHSPFEQGIAQHLIRAFAAAGSSDRR